MSKSHNVFSCSGYLCADPRINDLASGSRVANLRLAINYSAKEDGEWTDKALFFDVEIWSGVDAVETYMHKGSGIEVFGTLAEREWTTPDGEVRKTLCIKNAQWSFPPKSGESGEDPQPRQAAPARAATAPAKAGVSAADFADDSIPF